MLSAGEIGVIFGVKDEASVVLQRIADQFNEIQKIVDRFKASLETIAGADGGLLKIQEQFKATGAAGDDAGNTISAAFTRVDGSIGTTIERVAALRASLLDTAETAKAINFTPSIGRGGAPGEGGGGGGTSQFMPHVSPGGTGFTAPGGTHIGWKGPVAAGVAAVAEGTWEEAKMQDVANRMFMTEGIAPGSDAAKEMYPKIREAALKAYKQTGWTCLGKVESSSEGKRSISWASRSDDSGRNLRPKRFGWLR